MVSWQRTCFRGRTFCLKLWKAITCWKIQHWSKQDHWYDSVQGSFMWWLGSILQPEKSIFFVNNLLQRLRETWCSTGGGSSFGRCELVQTLANSQHRFPCLEISHTGDSFLRLQDTSNNTTKHLVQILMQTARNFILSQTTGPTSSVWLVRVPGKKRSFPKPKIL